ncbi:uncharacterized protein LOC124596232 [Schistocerca americana]|uniref:uncharacterized protein LOC124596232 n=1 Tax=Schistocerca americana TaxID=7009 RepID=UPI001F4F7144|nr:uncharacterized protein LOC124596232 [Schistocerca americana]
MRDTIVPSVQQQRKTEATEQLAGKYVVMLADEATDRREHCVFAVLLRTIEAWHEQKLFVASVKVLNAANSTHCARTILRALQTYNIQYGNVKAVVNDSARYMNKYVDSLKTVIGDNLMHVQCWAHKINLIANIYSKELSKLNTTISYLKSALLSTRKRKHLYLQFLKEKNRNPKVFPPVLTRRNSSLSTAVYVAEYFEVMIEFFRNDYM